MTMNTHTHTKRLFAWKCCLTTPGVIRVKMIVPSEEMVSGKACQSEFFQPYSMHLVSIDPAMWLHVWWLKCAKDCHYSLLFDGTSVTVRTGILRAQVLISANVGLAQFRLPQTIQCFECIVSFELTPVCAQKEYTTFDSLLMMNKVCAEFEN